MCDEDGYNVYLGNIHCLFMNALMMKKFIMFLMVIMLLMETFAAFDDENG